jgi:hypothetical protein
MTFTPQPIVMVTLYKSVKEKLKDLMEKEGAQGLSVNFFLLFKSYLLLL